MEMQHKSAMDTQLTKVCFYFSNYDVIIYLGSVRELFYTGRQRLTRIRKNWSQLRILLQNCRGARKTRSRWLFSTFSKFSLRLPLAKFLFLSKYFYDFAEIRKEHVLILFSSRARFHWCPCEENYRLQEASLQGWRGIYSYQSKGNRPNLAWCPGSREHCRTSPRKGSFLTFWIFRFIT